MMGRYPWFSDATFNVISKPYRLSNIQKLVPRIGFYPSYLTRSFAHWTWVNALFRAIYFQIKCTGRETVCLGVFRNGSASGPDSVCLTGRPPRIQVRPLYVKHRRVVRAIDVKLIAGRTYRVSDMRMTFT